MAIKLVKEDEANNPHRRAELFSEGRIFLSPEAALMLSVPSHGNLVHTVGVCQNPLGIVMEFLPLGSLRDYLRQNDLTLSSIFRVLSGTAVGMEFLHSRDIIHRFVLLVDILAT